MKYELVAISDTLGKTRALQSSELSDLEKFPIEAGDRFLVESLEDVGDHYRVSIYLYKPHFDKFNRFAELKNKFLSEDDYKRVANEIGCDVATVKAVVKIESSGSGFFKSGKPKILFEAHIFSRLTNHRFDSTNPQISSKVWNRSLYKGGEAEYDRLDAAATLDRAAALQSASWGIGQVLGLNYKVCGFPSVFAFVESQYRSEGEQLDTMFAFIKNKNLAGALRSRDWTSFARVYNGASYAKNRYDEKLKSAYAEFAKK